MRKIHLLTTTLAFGSASMTSAGGMAEPVMKREVIEQTTSSSSQGIIVPLLLLLVIAALASSGGSGGGGPTLSDRRLKTGIRRIGITKLGLPLYRWRYDGLKAEFEGVMAQDVEILHPGAIRPMPFGYKAVDYDRLGLNLTQVAA